MSLINQPADAIMLRDNLREHTEALRKRRDELVAGAQNTPDEITTEDEAAALTDRIAQINAFVSMVDGLEKKLKAPHQSAVKQIGSYFAVEFATIGTVKRKLTNTQTAFMKEAARIEAVIDEARQVRGDWGSVATLRTRWVHEVEDYTKVDRALVWYYLDAAAVDKAIRAAIKAGVRDISGVRIFKEEKAVVQHR